MAVNKVGYGTRTLIDLTNDTVTADSLFSGVTAHDKTGAIITGTYEPLTKSDISALETTVSTLQSTVSGLQSTINTINTNAKNASSYSKTARAYSQKAASVVGPSNILKVDLSNTPTPVDVLNITGKGAIYAFEISSSLNFTIKVDGTNVVYCSKYYAGSTGSGTRYWEAGLGVYPVRNSNNYISTPSSSSVLSIADESYTKYSINPIVFGTSLKVSVSAKASSYRAFSLTLKYTLI